MSGPRDKKDLITYFEGDYRRWHDAKVRVFSPAINMALAYLRASVAIGQRPVVKWSCFASTNISVAWSIHSG